MASNGFWNHRVIQHEEGEGGAYLGIHEVYYDDAGAVTSWTATPIRVLGHTSEELLVLAARVAEAVGNPHLLPVEDGLKELKGSVVTIHDPGLWYPVDGDTRNYEGDIVLWHKNRDYRLGHSSWVSDQLCENPKTGKSVPNYQELGLDRGYFRWKPLIPPREL